tara:strand:+ start:1152 stop:1742 length:591 start_codon:yes stop_codon:yes gene_type:complete
MTVSIVREIWRKSLHITILLILILYSYIETNYKPQIALVTLVAFLIIFILLEYMRLELNWKMEFYNFFIRPKEHHRMIGSVYFLLSTIITLAVFDKRIAIAALLMTAFGDSTAAIIGKKYGTSLIYKNKTWVGSISEFIVNLIVGFFILSSYFNIYVILGMALAATFVEILVDELDDNLLTPIITGFVGQIIKFAF